MCGDEINKIPRVGRAIFYKSAQHTRRRDRRCSQRLHQSEVLEKLYRDVNSSNLPPITSEAYKSTSESNQRRQLHFNGRLFVYKEEKKNNLHFPSFTESRYLPLSEARTRSTRRWVGGMGGFERRECLAGA